MTDKYTPGRSDYISLKGKQYLPARRRVQWFRGEHPDWTLNTSIVQLDVVEGWALVRAEVLDETGRLIAASHKTEERSDFGDFVEKAETGAIGRAVALAGFGTEDALDLDEDTAISDAPVEPRNKQSGQGERSTSARSDTARTPAPADKRQVLADLAARKGLNAKTLEDYADVLKIPKDRRATDEELDKLIAAVEGHGTDVPLELPLDDPALPDVPQVPTPID